MIQGIAGCGACPLHPVLINPLVAIDMIAISSSWAYLLRQIVVATAVAR